MGLPRRLPRTPRGGRLPQALSWSIVPGTWLRDGPFGEGMVQLWQETDPEQDPVDLVPAEGELGYVRPGGFRLQAVRCLRCPGRCFR